MEDYKQLSFSFNNDDIINDYYKTYEELPDNWKTIIDNYIHSYNYTITDSYVSRYFFDENNIYCPKCLSLLAPFVKNTPNRMMDDGIICSNCDIDYSNKSIIKANCNNNELLEYDIHMLFLEPQGDSVIGYVIKCNISYYKYILYRKYDLSISNILYIADGGLYDIIDSSYHSFVDYERELLDNDLEEDEKEIYYKNEIYKTDIEYVYFNIDELKKTKVYKYIDLSSLLEAYNDGRKSAVEVFMFYPVYYKQVEKLLKMGLTNLALDEPYLVKDGNTFKEAFGLPKKYYEFMKSINIDGYLFSILQMYNTDDEELLNFIAILVRYFGEDYLKELFLTTRDIKKLYDYMETNNIDYHDYYDYIRFTKDLGLTLVKYPKDFRKKHDKLYKDYTISHNKDSNDKLIKIHNYLKINIYEDDKYIIFPCYDIDSLIDESSQMNNCVRTYINRIIDHECFIFFMRDKSDVTKSLVTVEVRKGEVVQARRKNNTDITLEDRNFLDKFEENFVDIRFKD